MDLSSQQILTGVLFILFLLFFFTTIILAIKFKLFSIMRFNFLEHGKNKKNTAQSLTAPDITVTKHITEQIRTTGTVTCNFQELKSSAAVAEGQHAADTDTAGCSDRFIITKNIIVIHSDPGTIK